MVTINAPWDKFHKFVLYIGIALLVFSFYNLDRIDKDKTALLITINKYKARLEVNKKVDSLLSNDHVQLYMLELSYKNLIVSNEIYNNGLRKEYQVNKEALNKEEKEELNNIYLKKERIARKRDSLFSIKTEILAETLGISEKNLESNSIYLVYFIFSAVLIYYGAVNWYLEDKNKPKMYR